MNSLEQGKSFETFLFLSALKCEKETHSFVVSHTDQVGSACERCLCWTRSVHWNTFTNNASWKKCHL